MAVALLGCEVSTVVGVRGPDEGFGDAGSGAETGEPPILDLPDSECEAPEAVSCDAASEDPLRAIGLDCVGGIPAAGALEAPAGAAAVHSGSIGPYAPREGDKFLILSTGQAAQLPLTHAELASFGCDDPLYCPSSKLSEEPTVLPAPLTVEPVDESLTCVDDPSLVGMGDCSNSLFEQWSACGVACELWDYAELRVSLTVPEQTLGLAFDFAFMSVEWPEYAGGGFNDMFIAWLESESWTGNVSFDELGNPITVNASFTDYTEFEGFSMAGHAGTDWLSTDVGVTPGESVTLVLAIFDINDGYHDSVVLLDRVRWTCTGTPPTTQPVP